MPINKKDNLQKLLKSLSKNEKKIFRESLRTNQSDSLYLKLFNLIDKKANPTQKELNKLIDNKANQLGVIKTYLTKLILRTLKTLPADNSLHTQIHHSFLDFQIFLKKDLLELAEAEINKTIKLTRQSEQLPGLIQALEYKKQLLIQKFGANSESSKKDLNDILEEQKLILESLQNLHQYQKLQTNFYDQFHQSSGLTRTIYTTLHTNPLLTSDHSPKSTSAKILQAELLYSLHIYKDQNYQEAFSATNKIIKQLELNPDYISLHPEAYLNLLNQQLQLLIHLRKFQEIPNLLKKIRQSPETFHFDFKQPNLLRTTLETFQIELQLYTETKDFHGANQLLPQVQAIYKHLHSPALKQWQTLLNYEIARLHFAQQNYPAALQTISQLTHSPHSLREQETLLQALFLAASIHVHQKQFLQLKKILKSIDQVFQNGHRPAQVAEKQIIRLLQTYPENLLKPTRHKQLNKQFNQLYKTLEKRQNSMLFELVNWLEQAFLLESK